MRWLLILWQTVICTFVPDKPPAANETGWNIIKQNQLWQTEYQPLLQNLDQPSATTRDSNRPAWEVVRAWMERSHTPFYFLICALFFLAALVVVWSILPAIMGELRFGIKKGKSPIQKERKSTWLGESLSGGFGAMRVSGEIVRWTFLLLRPVQVLIATHSLRKYPELSAQLRPLNEGFLFVGAAIVLGIIASRGPFKVLAFWDFVPGST